MISKAICQTKTSAHGLVMRISVMEMQPVQGTLYCMRGSLSSSPNLVLLCWRCHSYKKTSTSTTHCSVWSLGIQSQPSFTVCRSQCMLPHVFMTLANTSEKPNGGFLRASSVHGRMGFSQARYLLGSPSKLMQSQSLVRISTNNLAYLLASIGRSPIPKHKGFFLHYNGGYGSRFVGQPPQFATTSKFSHSHLSCANPCGCG